MPDPRPLRILHFADAHIDIANFGRHDPATALPVRVMDFLASLDQIVDTAISTPVDLVLFAGDAYKDRNPQPTFQKAWGQRIIRLSQAGIPTLLLVGNHDVMPAAGRAHTLHEFETLRVPHIHVADRIRLFSPSDLGLPLQILAVPWITRSALMTREDVAGKSLDEIHQAIEERVEERIEGLLQQSDPTLPLILTAHATIRGAAYGSERTVMLGHELVLSPAVVKQASFDYVALGHIHCHQELNRGSRPPVVYPGSIERINFGEARETKGFVLADIEKGRASWEFVTLKTRPHLDLRPETRAADSLMTDILAQLPETAQVAGAICRVQLSYPREWEPLLDESAIFAYLEPAHSVHILKTPQGGPRSRLGEGLDVEGMSPADLLEVYWKTTELDEAEVVTLQRLAAEILAE
ncbi:MAG: metallophosphoesterase family protein [Candidatus Promineifilaceae bacterium]